MYLANRITEYSTINKRSDDDDESKRGHRLSIDVATTVTALTTMYNATTLPLSKETGMRPRNRCEKVNFDSGETSIKTNDREKFSL